MTKYLDKAIMYAFAAALLLGLADLKSCNIPNVLPIVTPPSPVASDSLRVLIVEESSQRSKLPLGQLAVLTSTPLRKWLESQNATWRMVDANDSPQDLDDTMKVMFARQRATLPWLIVCGPKGGAEGPLPDSPDAAIKAVEQFTTRQPSRFDGGGQ
jgi:hypothetical protein